MNRFSILILSICVASAAFYVSSSWECGIIVGLLFVLLFCFYFFKFEIKNNAYEKNVDPKLVSVSVPNVENTKDLIVFSAPRPAINKSAEFHKVLAPWVYEETISHEIAEGLIKASTWWLTHASGPVRAPGFARRMYLSRVHGWSVDFGANSFLVGKAIKRAQKRLLDAEEKYGQGMSISEQVIEEQVINALCGSVSNVNGDEYNYYPANNGDLVFGAQAIDIKDAVRYIIGVSSADKLYVTNQALQSS